MHPEGKYVVDVAKDIEIEKLKTGERVALKNDSYSLHLVLPSLVDPLVSLMKVEKVPDSTFDMIGGLDQQVKEIKEVVELPIKHPELFESLGIAQPKGVILYGPPGTGKTLLARAVAHHTDCCFIRVSGSELVQKYIGEGARMVRELFVMARENAPAILFMDEVDSIGSARGSGGGDSEVQRPCSSSSTSSTASSPRTRSRCSWRPTGSTSWMRRCCAPGALTGKSSSPTLRSPRASTSFGSTRGR